MLGFSRQFSQDLPVLPCSYRFFSSIKVHTFPALLLLTVESHGRSFAYSLYLLFPGVSPFRRSLNLYTPYCL